MKIIKWLMVFLMSLTIGLNFVKAEVKTTTMEEVRTKLEEKLNSEELVDSEMEIKVVLEESKMVIKLVKGEEEKELAEFTRESDALSLERTIKINELEERDNVGENPSIVLDSDADFSEAFDAFTIVLLDALIYDDLLNVVGELRGYNERDIRNFVDTEKATFASDGYELKIEEKQEQKETTYTYKIDINKFVLNVEYTEIEPPKIELVDITDTQIGIKLSGVEDGTMVEIYRSEDGENYTWWQTVSAMKDGSVTNIDSGLKPNTKYYYKAIVLKSNKFSDFVSATTLEKTAEKDDVDKPAESPQTGFKDYLILGTLGASGIILTSYILKNKQKFYKI